MLKISFQTGPLAKLFHSLLINIFKSKQIFSNRMHILWFQGTNDGSSVYKTLFIVALNSFISRVWVAEVGEKQLLKREK